MKVCVYIGRFQPFHFGHLTVLRAALSKHDKVIVVLGSSQSTRDYAKNPWEAYERMLMIAGSLGQKDLARTRFIFQDDHSDNAAWVDEVVHSVLKFTVAWENQTGDVSTEVFLTGARKDDSSFYIDLLPWEFIEAPPHGMINATDIRAALASIATRAVLGASYDYLWSENVTLATRLVIKANLHQQERDRLFTKIQSIIHPMHQWSLTNP